MAALISIPILTLVIILQSAVLSQIMLLQASADLMLVVVVSWMMQDRVKSIWPWAIVGGLWVGFVSELPMWVPMAGYLFIAWIGMALKRRVWRAPILALFTTIVLGTVLLQGITFISLRISGVAIDPLEAFNLVLLPGLLLNLLLALPIQGVTSELASWFYPEEIDT